MKVRSRRTRWKCVDKCGRRSRAVKKWNDKEVEDKMNKVFAKRIGAAGEWSTAKKVKAIQVMDTQKPNMKDGKPN